MVAEGKVQHQGTEKSLGKILETFFEENKIRLTAKDIRVAEDIVATCKSIETSAFKAATEICHELAIEVRLNRALLERTLLSNGIFKN